MTYATRLRRAFAGATLLFGLTIASSAAWADQPDIIIFLADDLGSADIGPVRRELATPTPTIDAIGKGGITFTSGYGQPVCIQARTALMAGKWPQRRSVGAVVNNGPQPSGSMVTLAERLRSLGYGTHIIGKWHLGWGAKTSPMGQGFDTFLGWTGFTPNYVGDDPKAPLYRQRTLLHNSGLVTTTIATETIRLMELKPAAPQLYYVAFTAPHNPFQGSFGDRVAEMDAAMGRILRHARPGSLIIFAGDNGRGYDNAPFRGKKFDILEGGVRVPLALKWTGRVAAGQRIDTPASLIDIARTVVEAAGGRFGDSDGYNLLDLPADRALLFKALHADHGFGVRQGRWKLYQDYLGQPERLYDVISDKGERIPVANPAVANQLRELIANFRAELAN